MKPRESIEWCDMWVTGADVDEGAPRALLVGDSITQSYYKEVEIRLGDKFRCAKLATSLCVCDPRIITQLALLLDEFKFDVIHFNNGHLLQLADGRLLLSYGVRNRGSYGVAVRFSNDAGATWGPPRQLVTLCDNLQRNKLYPKGEGRKTPYTEIQDGGYPSSVQIEDGIIVTAYYSRGIPEHDRYHMGVVRWLAELPQL